MRLAKNFLTSCKQPGLTTSLRVVLLRIAIFRFSLVAWIDVVHLGCDLALLFCTMFLLFFAS